MDVADSYGTGGQCRTVWAGVLSAVSFLAALGLGVLTCRRLAGRAAPAPT